jgi:HK97 family phage portal protein
VYCTDLCIVMAWNFWPFGNKPNSTPVQNQSFWVNFIPSLTPAKVTPETALGVSAVWACCRVLSESIASLPFSVYREVDGDINPATQHPLYRLLHDKPHSWYNSFTFRESLMLYANLHGNAMARILRRSSMDPTITGFQIIDVRYVSIIVDVEGYVAYVVSKPGKEVEVVLQSDMIHITAMSMDGVTGQTPIQAVYNTFQEAIDSQRYQSATTVNGARIGGYIKYPGKLTAEGVEKLRNGWQDKYGGASNAGKTAVLEEGAEFIPVSMNNKDLQIIEQRKLTIEDIARCYRVPLHLIGDLSRSTNNNIEHQSIEFVQHTLYPWVKRWETEFNDKCFTERQKQEGYFVRLNMEGFQRGDSKSRSDYYATMHRIGALSQNEIRRLEGFNSIGAEGDQYFVQGAMVPTSQLNSQDNEPATTTAGT